MHNIIYVICIISKSDFLNSSLTLTVIFAGVSMAKLIRGKRSTCVEEHGFCLKRTDCCPAFLGKYLSDCWYHHCRNDIFTSSSRISSSSKVDASHKNRPNPKGAKILEAVGKILNRG